MYQFQRFSEEAHALMDLKINSKQTIWKNWIPANRLYECRLRGNGKGCRSKAFQ